MVTGLLGLMRIFLSGELRIPTIGYSAMQEQYAHTPFDKCRIDFIEKAMAGNAAIFMKASQLPREKLEKTWTFDRNKTGGGEN